MLSLTFATIDGLYAVYRLPADAPLPSWAIDGPAGAFVSITRTAEEVSIVCRQDLAADGIRSERGLRVLRVAGTLDFALVGVLAALLAPLAGAGVSAFAISTFDTDYLLVKEDRLADAVAALRRAGHTVDGA